MLTELFLWQFLVAAMVVFGMWIALRLLGSAIIRVYRRCRKIYGGEEKK